MKLGLEEHVLTSMFVLWRLLCKDLLGLFFLNAQFYFYVSAFWTTSLGISSSVLSATCVSVNRLVQEQKGAKFCPIPDLWPEGAFFLTGGQFELPSLALLHSFTQTCLLPHEGQATHDRLHLHWPSPTDTANEQHNSVARKLCSLLKNPNTAPVNFHSQIMNFLLCLCCHYWLSKHCVESLTTNSGRAKSGTISSLRTEHPTRGRMWTRTWQIGMLGADSSVSARRDLAPSLELLGPDDMP